MHRTSYHFHFLVALLASALLSHTTYAGNVSGLTEFKDKTAANAADVNGNFTTIQNAVNDNDARIGTLENTVKNIPAGPVAPTTQFSYGRTAATPGRSCLDIKTVVPWSGDGIYLIDPDGTGPIETFPVRCDMTRDGGGWTYILKNRYQSGMAGKAAGFGTVYDLQNRQQDFYKIADATINAIIGDGNFDMMADQVGHNAGYSTGNNEYVIVRNYTATFSFTALVPESTTPTVFESYRSVDSKLNWRGRLLCGTTSGGVGVGINCQGSTALALPSPVGATNPQGGLGCLFPLGTNSDPGWNTVAMSWFNTDTYLYVCNGAQHSSSYDLSHQWWVR